MVCCDLQKTREPPPATADGLRATGGQPQGRIAEQTLATHRQLDAHRGKGAQALPVVGLHNSCGCPHGVLGKDAAERVWRCEVEGDT